MDKWSVEKIKAHLEAIIKFLRRHERLWRAHVVEFFQERLWEILDADWIERLESASINDLLLLPSHISKDFWPETLKEFLNEAQSLALPRHLDTSEMLLSGSKLSLPKIVSDGMNPKKLHEIERLSSLIVNISRVVDATQVIDIGAGQGYLAQVLAFQHGLHVVAVDCSAHNTCITDKRAQRIRSYYETRGHGGTTGPKSVTCRIGLDGETVSLNSLLSSINNDDKQPELNNKHDKQPSLVLAGLHACGDLSANMLRTFVQQQSVKAVISVGCCYNLLTEDKEQCGFPLSKGLKSFNFHIGGAGRDLGCQSADRWKDIGQQTAKENFELHAYRAALQMVFYRFYPGIAEKSPSVGRVGKTKRRKQSQKRASKCETDKEEEENTSCQRFNAFQEYTAMAFKRLSLPDIPKEHLLQIWQEAEPFLKLIGPFWALRAAIAPVLETLILLDRLLYLKESETEGFTCTLLPVFDPSISPRNMAVIAVRN